jgi:hypothetical protein
MKHFGDQRKKSRGPLRNLLISLQLRTSFRRSPTAVLRFAIPDSGQFSRTWTLAHRGVSHLKPFLIYKEKQKFISGHLGKCQIRIDGNFQRSISPRFGSPTFNRRLLLLTSKNAVYCTPILRVQCRTSADRPRNRETPETDIYG